MSNPESLKLTIEIERIKLTIERIKELENLEIKKTEELKRKRTEIKNLERIEIEKQEIEKERIRNLTNK